MKKISLRSLPIRLLFFALPLFALLFGGCGGRSGGAEEKAAEEEASYQGPYGEDNRLKLQTHTTYVYDRDKIPAEGYLWGRYMWIAEGYDEEEIAESSHAAFDDKNRMLYMLGYTSAILENRVSYCEEQIFEWDDVEHTCRHIYYKSNSSLYDSGFYVAFRYMFDVCHYQFTHDGRLLLRLDYSRNVGSDPYGYSEELYFDRGYQAEYEGERLTEELICYNFWGTNEAGSWEYRNYQYNEQGDCTLRVAVNEDEILVSCYEYHTDLNRVEEYTYCVKENWELSCGDGSILRLKGNWESPAVEKTASDGRVERELFYGRITDMGQEPYLMPEDVEATVDDHKYVVKPGDSLWSIAYEAYGQGAWYDLLYRVNRELIGSDVNLIQPGVRLYVPEAGNEQDTRKK